MSASLEGRHIVITGATSGLGLAAASALAEKGADLTLVVRDVTRGKRVAKSLQEKCGCPPVKVERCDMAEMADVHALAERMLKRKRPIDVLINNAGALFNPRQETSEGFEKSFALLLLGPYILTERLQPLLSKATDARVVNVLSGGMYSQGIDVDDLQSEEGDYSGSNAYARAKRGLMILTEEWAEQWSGDGITVNAMHPGWANTAGVRDALPEFYKVTKSILRTPEEGADTIVWLAAASEANQVSGKFWLDREQHPPHIFPHTKETAEDRATLLLRLAEYKAATAEQTAVA